MILGIEASHANKVRRTGVEEYCFEIIQALKKIIPADVRVVLYTNTPLIDGLRDLPENWREEVLTWPFRKGWSQFRLAEKFFHEKPDVFFAPGQLVPFVAPRNTVTTIHDSAFIVYPKAYRLLGRMYLCAMNRLVLHKSKMIITPSDFSRQELARLYHADLNRIKVTPLGYDKNVYRKLNLSDEEKRVVLKKYNITKPFFITVGRLELKKNTGNIIEAFNQIKKQLDAQLLLVGIPGCGFEDIENRLGQSPYNADIFRPGWVGQEDLPKLYNLSAGLLFPSNYEGFGLPLLHAMACGCPVVASKGNSLAEVGADAPAYAGADSPKEIADAAVGIFLDRDRRSSLIEKGLNQAEKFSWEKTGQMTWDILREAAK